MPSYLPDSRFSSFILFCALTLTACERGCARSWLRDQGVGETPPAGGRASMPVQGIDCPDGLARCVEGRVEASRLAVIPQPCRGPESHCACPWDEVAVCDRGCAADGAEVIVEKAAAARQLCKPAPGADFVRPAAAGRRAPQPCEEEQLYRCVGGDVVGCDAIEVAGTCIRGCFAEGASIDEASPGVTREAAFAILCSR